MSSSTKNFLNAQVSSTFHISYDTKITDTSGNNVN